MMDFLKAEIERKKRLVEEKGVTAGPQKKYFRRGDLAEKERQEYLKRHSAPSNDDEKVKQIKQSKEEARKALRKFDQFAIFDKQKTTLVVNIDFSWNVFEQR